MKFYDNNIHWATAEVEVTLQSEEYKGKFSTIVSGDVRGVFAIETVIDFIRDGNIAINKNNCNFEIYFDEDFFTCDLKDNEGNELNIETLLDDLDEYIVGIEIIKYGEYIE